MSNHQKTKTCCIGRDERENKILQNKQAKGGEVEFYINGKELERMEEFKYLGSILPQDDHDTTAIIRQIKKARQSWNRITRKMKHEGSNAITIATFYSAVVQSI